MEFNIADLFECVAASVSERTALVGGPRRLTFGALDERATRAAHVLADHGVGPQQHVGLLLGNRTEYIELMLACFKLRAVPVNLNYRYVASELAAVCDDADTVAVVAEPGLADRAHEARARVACLSAVLSLDDGYETALATAPAAGDFPARSGGDHYVLYTGGTTGRPKGVIWRHDDIFFAGLGGGNPGGPPITAPDEIGAVARASRGQRVRPFLADGDPGPGEFVALSLAPLMHAGGQWLTLGTLLGGGTAVLYPDAHMDMARVLSLVERERVTMLSLVGDASARPLIGAARAGEGEGVERAPDTSSLLLLGSGAAMLSADAKRQLLAAFPSVLAIIEGMGSSESPAQAVAVTTRHDTPAPSLTFPPRETTIVVDDDLRPVPAGSGVVGRLATRGHVPLGYYKDPERSARTFVEIDGARWALPGDMATVDHDGTIRVVGRGSLCINTGGEKVYPEEVEAVVKTCAGVGDAVVVGVPDERWGERVGVVVAPVDRAAPPTLAALQDHCRAHLAGYKIPRVLHVVAGVERSPAGKADYQWARSVIAPVIAPVIPPVLGTETAP